MIHLIGDVQGCDAALGRLLQALDFSPSRDHLVLLGDLVNRGPDSLAVLQRLVALEGAATCLLGNHDLHLLAVAAGARRLHKSDTFADVLASPRRAELLQWLRQRPLACEAAGWLCVHAGVAPHWSRADTLEEAAEVQRMLRGPDASAFFHAMYSEEPQPYRPGAQGVQRWRYAVDVLTRIRFCTPEGTLDMKTKEAAAAAPPGHQPWFDVPGRRSAGTPIAFGHWSTLGPLQRPDLLALDTGCVWGGCLSAARVDGGRADLVQVKCPQAQDPLA